MTQQGLNIIFADAIKRLYANLDVHTQRDRDIINLLIQYLRESEKSET